MTMYQLRHVHTHVRGGGENAGVENAGVGLDIVWKAVRIKYS